MNRPPLPPSRRIKSRSKKAADAAHGQADVKVELYLRDRGVCVLASHAGRWATWTSSGVLFDEGGIKIPPCFGHWTPHHLRKSVHGGPYDLENLVTACAGHNDWIEDQPDLCRALGLVVAKGVDHAEALTRRQAAGLTR